VLNSTISSAVMKAIGQPSAASSTMMCHSNPPEQPERLQHACEAHLQRDRQHHRP